MCFSVSIRTSSFEYFIARSLLRFSATVEYLIRTVALVMRAATLSTLIIAASPGFRRKFDWYLRVPTTPIEFSLKPLIDH